MGRTRELAQAAVILFALAAIVMLFVYPQSALDAAARGVSIWWEILFPALFPFFVLSEMMLKLGIVHFFGTILDPLMRPLFRVPGIGGFVMAMGFASGYPVGAKLTSQLYQQGALNREEGERLIAFTTTSDPIFLIGAVSVGFFHDPSIALVLAAAHYGSAVLIGLSMRFYKMDLPLSPYSHSSSQPVLVRAFFAMHEARTREKKPFSLLFRDAVTSSLPLIFVIGGLVVFFSVILELLTVSGLIHLLHAAVHGVLGLLGMPSPLTEAIISGIFEVTLGAKTAAGAGENIPLVHRAAAAAFILSWGGLSVHFQVISLFNHTPFRYRPFIVCRFLHGLLAAVSVYALWDLFRHAPTVFAVQFPSAGMAETILVAFWVQLAFLSALVILFSLCVLVLRLLR